MRQGVTYRDAILVSCQRVRGKWLGGAHHGTVGRQSALFLSFSLIKPLHKSSSRCAHCPPPSQVGRNENRLPKTGWHQSLWTPGGHQVAPSDAQWARNGPHVPGWRQLVGPHERLSATWDVPGNGGQKQTVWSRNNAGGIVRPGKGLCVSVVDPGQPEETKILVGMQRCSSLILSLLLLL